MVAMRPVESTDKTTRHVFIEEHAETGAMVCTDEMAVCGIPEVLSTGHSFRMDEHRAALPTIAGAIRA